MTTNEAYNLIYSLHAAIEGAKDNCIDLDKVFENTKKDYIDGDIAMLLHAGHFGLDCFKKYLEIVASLLVDNDIIVNYDEVANGYYSTEEEQSIIERCTEIAAFSRKIKCAEESLNNVMLQLSTLDKSIFE